MTSPTAKESGNNTNQQPRVLIATAREWLSGARLALAFRHFGCDVSLLSPAKHPARLTGAVSHWTHFSQLRPFRSFERALDATPPDFLILADEIVMHDALLLAGKDNHYGQRLRQLTDGAAPAIRLARSRYGLLDQARQLHVGVPDTQPVPSLADLADAAKRLGFPLVLKAGGSAGGQGVRITQNMAEAETAWTRLHRPPTLPRVLKRGFVDKEWMHVRSWMRRETATVSAERWIGNREVTSMAVAHNGKMLGSVEFDVVQTIGDRGPSSVLRVIEEEKARDAMARVIAHLNMTGFCGFDFIRESGSGDPLLIEMNTRPTQLSYLPLGEGKDLVAAYVREVIGLKHVKDRPAATENPLIALFPQELRRDPQSAWVKDAWMDVPWESPALIDFALNAGRKKLSRDLIPTRDAGTGARAAAETRV